MESTEVNPKNWKTLIKPTKLDVQLSDDKSHAKITAEPLEKGYGLTLGNSLRRILLSSIRGTAVTAIQIDGVLHEFTSIKGVREDVTDIVLNVKSLALKSSSDAQKKLILDAKGPGEIKASDITQIADVEILNPELVICNLDENTNFHMEMIVGHGKGYVSADMNKPDEPPLGLIPIDSLFSAVKKRGFDLEETHLTDPQRLSNLFYVVSIAFVWAYRQGDFVVKNKPIKLKNHGYPQHSIVRHGLDVHLVNLPFWCDTANLPDAPSSGLFLRWKH